MMFRKGIVTLLGGLLAPLLIGVSAQGQIAPLDGVVIGPDSLPAPLTSTEQKKFVSFAIGHFKSLLPSVNDRDLAVFTEFAGQAARSYPELAGDGNGSVRVPVAELKATYINSLYSAANQVESDRGTMK